MAKEYDTNDRCNALLSKIDREIIAKGFHNGSAEYYAAKCGALSACLFNEMLDYDLYKKYGVKVTG